MRKLILLTMSIVLGATIAFAEESQTAVDNGQKVLLEVVGVELTEKMFDEMIDGMIMQQFQQYAAMIPAEQLKQIIDQNRPQFVEQYAASVAEVFVRKTLANYDAEKKNIATDPKIMDEMIEEVIDNQAKMANMTRKQMEEIIIERELGTSIKEFFSKQLKDNEDFNFAALHRSVLQKLYPKELVVTDEEVKNYYNLPVEKRYTEMEEVKASHILASTAKREMDEQTGQANMVELSDEEKAQARKKIEKVQAELKAGKDFSELAKENSDCPSGDQSGGDLGFFPRHGAMVEPFAKAAFDLEVNQISDIVETQFGYHIIKVTEKTDARDILTKVRSSEVDKKYYKELLEREKDKIIYNDSRLKPKPTLEIKPVKKEE